MQFLPSFLLSQTSLWPNRFRPKSARLRVHLGHHRKVNRSPHSHSLHLLVLVIPIHFCSVLLLLSESLIWLTDNNVGRGRGPYFFFAMTGQMCTPLHCTAYLVGDFKAVPNEIDVIEGCAIYCRFIEERVGFSLL